jgi:hypothetical protein
MSTKSYDLILTQIVVVVVVGLFILYEGIYLCTIQRQR